MKNIPSSAPLLSTARIHFTAPHPMIFAPISWRLQRCQPLFTVAFLAFTFTALFTPHLWTVVTVTTITVVAAAAAAAAAAVAAAAAAAVAVAVVVTQVTSVQTQRSVAGISAFLFTAIFLQFLVSTACGIMDKHFTSPGTTTSTFLFGWNVLIHDFINLIR
jgi:hypothetical protein